MAATAHGQTLENVHLSSAGVQANGGPSWTPVMSDAGRYVAYISSATNLVAADPNGVGTDVFVRDRVTGTTVMITAGPAGGSNGACSNPSISGNGRYVAFQSAATNLVAPDANGTMADVFLVDRDTDADGVFDEAGATSIAIVSRNSAGTQGNRPSTSTAWAISDDGSAVAFTSSSSNFPGGGATSRCFVREIGTGTTTWISTSPTTFGGSSLSAAISGNGRYVVFQTIADLDPNDFNGTSDVYRYDRTTTALERVSVDSNGMESMGSAQAPAVSDDGSVIAFISEGDDLDPPDLSLWPDVFIHDMGTGATQYVSISTDGTPADFFCLGPALSGDGRMVAWFTRSPGLSLGDNNGVEDIFVRDIAAGVTVRASRGVAGEPGNGGSVAPALSDDGSLVAFSSSASNLLPVDAPDVNGVSDVFIRGLPFRGPGSGTPGMPGQGLNLFTLEMNPVTFSVNGPVDPHTEGIRYPRGGPVVPQVPLQPGNPYGFGIRTGSVVQATGINSAMRPGDVADYYAIAFPSEAVLFQSEPPTPATPMGAAPAGTNNQILESYGMGLLPGRVTPAPLWMMVPMMAPARDNLDAVSFGEDYFPPTMLLPGPMPMATPWETRVGMFPEPMVFDDTPGVSFRFSVDPWAIGAPATRVRAESGGADMGAGLGAWTSAGEAAGDVFGTPTLNRLAGVTMNGGSNYMVDENPSLALAPETGSVDPAEDDLDALEDVGITTNWETGAAIVAGNLDGRVMDVAGPGLPPPGESWHDPVAATPVFFSVTRNSVGSGGSAVRSQLLLDGGAAGDIFVAAKIPGEPPGVGTNLLFIDQAELGLMPTDDLDALILWVCPEYRYMIAGTIAMIAGGLAGAPMPEDSARVGAGMTISISKYLGIPLGCIRVGFSVTTDAVGMENTAVDFEAGPVGGMGGFSSAAGDVFYAQTTGAGVNTNYLWYEAEDLGLDPGGWVNGTSTNLVAVSDNLDALDSSPADSRLGIDRPDRRGGAELMLAPASPNPMRIQSTIPFVLPRAGHVMLTVTDITGRRVATLIDGEREAGRSSVVWEGRDARGRELPVGVYVIRLEFDGMARNRSLVLLR
ncbi:MAG TPA: FlgD immunoglobulin-like domain containing protein [Candidatus Eisenbacteria bacterium]|nr:FlgD immunoglobulin-like domain containing protein [Candidatus Eisenbacteria bacterium]